MPIQYVTVYEITQRFSDWPFACIGFIPLLIGAAVIWGKRRFKWSQPTWPFAILSCLFGIFWIVLIGSLTLSADSNAFRAYQNGDSMTVEGSVTDFHPMPYEGHQDECFSVQDQRFCYSDYDIGPGFHNATSHGGPIRADLPVRIAYHDGHILKLEVPSGQTPNSEQSAAISAQNERQMHLREDNDPFEQNMNTAFLFTAMCWTLWWNLQWRRVMRVWLKPPYRPWVEIAFRLFFALNFLGAVNGFMRQLYAHPLTHVNIRAVVQIAAIMCSVVALMSASVLWMAHRRDLKAVRLRPSGS